MIRITNRYMTDTLSRKGGETMEERHVCHICGEEHGLDDINYFEIKGKIKKICKKCTTIIHGLI